MNIPTQPVSFLPTSAVQPTDVLRRDNQMREAITQVNQNEAFNRERGLGSDSERSNSSNQNSYANQLADARQEAGFPRVMERNGERGNEEQKDQGRNEAESEDGEDAATEGELRELKQRDREVRQHEQAHAAIGGSLASAPSYEFQRGPDGRQYAVGGQVNIDITPIPGDPQATLQKMQVVRRAAMAPAQPSAADRQVAQEASNRAREARSEIREEQREARSVEDSERSSEVSGEWQVPESALQPSTRATVTRRLDDGSYDGTGLASEIPGFGEIDALMAARGERIERFYQGSFRPNESFLLGRA
ncbi:putative metalloprotease CJM1_0395 family protein [Aliidiomarina sp. Khilg15.8]